MAYYLFSLLALLLIIVNVGYGAVDFTETQDIGKLDEVTYPQFLQRIRDKLAKLPQATSVKGVPVLPPQVETKPLRWFDLILKSEDGKQTTLRFRGDNLYLIGYQMQNSKQWLELGKTGDKRYIDESTFLGFRGSYDALVGAAGVKSLLKVSLTKATLNKAAATLAESTKSSDRAGALIVIVQMVAEACRLDDITNHFTTNFVASRNFLVSWMVTELEQNWGDYSTLVYKADKCKGFNFPSDKVSINGQKIKTADELRKRLRVLLRTKKADEDCKKSFVQVQFQEDQGALISEGLRFAVV